MITCGACLTRHPEGAESCVRCGSELSQVCACCATTSPAHARFCSGCGAHLPSRGAQANGSAWPAAELRPITIFFCDVVGSSELSSRLDAEDVHALLREFHAACAELVRRHHGHVAQYLGDGLLAYFGYPVAREGDARGAARAALEIVQQAPQYVPEPLRGAGIDLQVRVGIHTGRVVVSTLGHLGRQETLALGQAPNIAARVQALAQPSTVVVTDSTRQLLGDQFRCMELGKRELRGVPQSVRVHQVLAEEVGSRTATDALAAGSGPFVGRSRELAELLERFGRAGGGASRIACVLGEPGIGKSRLVGELARCLRPEGVTILEGRCSPYHQGRAFHALSQCLQADLGCSLDAGAEPEPRALLELPLADAARREFHLTLLANVLRAPAPTGSSHAELAPAEQRSAIFEALRSWLAARRSATLLVLEDLHWADPSTLEFLSRYIVGTNGSAAQGAGGLFVVVTARPELELSALALTPSDSLVLRPLSAEDAECLARHAAGGRALSASQLQRLVAQGEGNPLFVEELTRALLHSDAVGEEERDALDPSSNVQRIPTTLQHTLTARLDLLGEAKPTAQLAAVVGREFRREVLAAVWRSVFGSSDAELERDLRQLIQSKLLHVREHAGGLVEYGFGHALMHDVAYQSLLRTQRRDYHQRVAHVLCERFPALAARSPDLLAQHYSAAAEPFLAAEHWEKAGHQALRMVAHQEAIGHFRAGLDELERAAPGPDRAAKELDLLVALGVLYIQTRGFAAREVETTYRRAVELCDETTHTPIRVLYGLWAVSLVRSELEPTSRLVPHWQRWVTSDDASARLISHACLGTWSFYRGHYALACEHLEHATALCDAQDPKAQHARLLREHGFEGLLCGPLYLAWCLATRGQSARAEATWQAALALAERMDDPYCSTMARVFGAALYHDLGQADKVLELGEQVLEVASKQGFPFWTATARITSGWALTMRGDTAQGIARIEAGLELLRAHGARLPYPYYLLYLAEAQLALERLDAAEAALDEALGMAASNVDRNHEPELLRQKAALCARRGRDERASELLERARRLAAERGSL